MPPKIFVIEGNIAAGKSTIIKNLKCKFVHVEEPISMWMENGIFQLYNQDPKRYAYSFQTFAFATRIKLFLQAYEKHGPDTTYLLERSWHSDRLFAKANYDAGYFTDIEWKMYSEWCDMHQKLVPFVITGFVYLKTSSQVCYDRLHERHRTTEELIKLTYLQSLEKSHEEFFSTRSHLTIVNNENRQSLNESTEVSRIDSYISSGSNEEQPPTAIQKRYKDVLGFIETIVDYRSKGVRLIDDVSFRLKLNSFIEKINIRSITEETDEVKDILCLYIYVLYVIYLDTLAKEEIYEFVMNHTTKILKRCSSDESDRADYDSRCDKLASLFEKADESMKSAHIISILQFMTILSIATKCETQPLSEIILANILSA